MKFFPIKHRLARAVIVTGLVLVASAGMVAGRDKPAVELVEESKAPRIEAPAGGADIDLSKLRRPDSAVPRIDPFAPRSFARSVQRAAGSAAAQAAPSAPPLPFSYFGRLTQDGKTEVFIMRGDELISIAAGSKIDSEYRVDEISGSRISFTYLPLKTRQALELAEAGQ